METGFRGHSGVSFPAQRVKRRPRLKESYFDQFNSNIIASFKSVPSLRSDQFKTQRPMMGLCCSCLSLSRKDLITDAITEEGIRNIFDVQTEMGKRNILTYWWPYLVYGLNRKDQGKFPDVSKAVLNNKRVIEAIQLTFQESLGLNNGTGKKRQETLATCKKSAKKILGQMKACVSANLIRFTGWFLLKFLSLFLRTIQVHKGQIEMIEKVSQRGAPVIYVPLHRSHLDYILVTFILWNYGVRAPYVAAGDNLDIPFFNMLMRGLGGFYIRRKLDKGSKKDHIYRAVLNTYMQELLKRGESFEFFIEGGRTRSGKSLIPKGGLLSIVVDSCTEGLIRDAYIVPISISYERLLDGNFRREQMGLPKIRESFFGAWKGILRVLWQNFGSVRIDFAQPFSIKEYIQGNPSQISRPLSPMARSGDNSPESSYPNLPNGLTSSSSRVSLQFDGIDNNRGLIKAIGRHIVHTAVNSASVTCTNMVAFLFITKFRKGVDMLTLISSFDWLLQEMKMRQRDVAFCGDSNVVVKYAVDLLGTDLVQETKVGSEKQLTPCVSLPAVFELTYYANHMISPFLLDSVIAHAILYCGKITLSNHAGEDNDTTISVSRDEVVAAGEDICKLLQEEFIFVPPCVRLIDALTDKLENFVSSEVLTEEQEEFDGVYSTQDRQWAKRLSAQLSWADEADDDDDEIFIESKPLKVKIGDRSVREKLQFYYSILGPILESYLVTAYQVSETLDSETQEADFIRQLLKYAQDRTRKEEALFAESASMDTLKNALKAYQALRIVDLFQAGNLRMVVLGESQQVRESLERYISILELSFTSHSGAQ